MATLMVGALLFRQNYNQTEVIGVLILTVGVVIATYADSANVTMIDNVSEDNLALLFWWAVGVALLFFGVLMTSTLTHLQSYGTYDLIQFIRCYIFYDSNDQCTP